MARKTTLIKLLDQLRAEAGLSFNPAHNNQTRDAHINLLQRVQQNLWDDFAWPHMRVERSIPIQSGQRFYDPPDDIDIGRIEALELFADGRWRPLAPGINGGHYGAHNSELDERAYPPRAWRLYEDEQLEIWPISDINHNPETNDALLRVIGIRQLNPLVADTDRADLDDRLITLFAAAEILGRSKQPDAQVKLDRANRLLARLRGGLVKTQKISVLGTGPRYRSRGPMITHYRPAGS